MCMLNKYSKWINRIKQTNLYKYLKHLNEKISKNKYIDETATLKKYLFTVIISEWILIIYTSQSLNILTVIGQMRRVFANGPGVRCSIPGRVIPKTQKWFFMPPCLTLSNIR